MGYSMDVLKEALGKSAGSRNSVMNLTRATRVTRGTERAVRALYDRLAMTPAPPGSSASQTRRWAQLRGWVGPLSWDDETIDDPTARPYDHRLPDGFCGSGLHEMTEENSYRPPSGGRECRECRTQRKRRK